jgi:hypothetical protein
MDWIPGWVSVAGSHWWSNFYFAASIGALILLGITEVISHRYSERKDELAAVEQTDTQKRYDAEIARLHLETAQADERAAKLEKDAAAANERAAEIMKATAWRQFQPDQAEKLRQVLAAHTGKAVVAWVSNDSESFSLAAQFLPMLESAHWEIRTSARTYAGSLIFGIWVPDTEGATASTNALRAALAAAGYRVATDKLPPESMSFAQEAGADFATILFGSKYPTFTQPP